MIAASWIAHALMKVLRFRELLRGYRNLPVGANVRHIPSRTRLYIALPHAIEGHACEEDQHDRTKSPLDTV